MSNKNFFNIDLSPQLVARRVGRPRRVRRYDGAQARFMEDWVTSSLTANGEILPVLRRLISRSRDLAQNNDYCRGFFKKLKINLTPAQARHLGMKLQLKARDPNGKPDERANKDIEAAWSDWCKPGNCDVTRRLSMADVIAVSAQSMARDGSCLIRKIHGFGNPHRFAVQLLDIDYLDLDLSTTAQNGNRIIGGVEVDKWMAPVAYHLHADHPGDSYAMPGTRKHIRVRASDIIHLFEPDRPEQLHAVPWFHASLIRMRMLGKYEESESIAARIGASQMGFFKTEGGSSYTGTDLTGTADDEGVEEPELIRSAEPGVFEELPPGVDFTAFDPNHPNSSFADFCRHMLRGAACGQGVSYINFANDLREANFASMRQGELSERDMWMLLQSWIGVHLLGNIFADWLRLRLSTSGDGYGMADYTRLNHPTWQGKRWAWIDPLKDAKANQTAMNMHAKTLGDIIAEAGGDFDDTMGRHRREKTVIDEIFGGDTDAG